MDFMKESLSLGSVLGPQGAGIVAAMSAGLNFIEQHSTGELLQRVGQRVKGLPRFTPIEKTYLQDSYGGNQVGPCDDFLVGRGSFYIAEQGHLFLDCTSGHYQMLWGYNHPALVAAVASATRAGITWDNHSNIPQSPVKRLAQRLVEAANDAAERDLLDTVLLGVCTGSVACAAALKIQLKVFERARGPKLRPVIVVLDGNYHGTDMVPQFMRGMWAGMLKHFQVVALPPNDTDALEKAFRKFGARIAGFWAEPIMMNREAIEVAPEFLHRAQALCRESGALLCIDEIQTGFWRGEIFDYRRLGLQPDLVVLGKGMTAGFHPLSGVLMRSRHDLLQQYDAISTNGSAALPAYVALCSMELIGRHAREIEAVGGRIQEGFRALAAEFPGRILSAQGRAHLSGLKFRRVADAKEFHRALLGAGLWTRVHAYHEGHSTILTKLSLLTNLELADFVVERFRALLRGKTSARRPAAGRTTR
jgi:acetylornithine/succinyldiaminopimelate/putrescine aminotransferase